MEKNENKPTTKKNTLLLNAEKKLNFQLPGTPFTIVSNGALNYEATDRILSLSQPRIKKGFEHTRPEFSDRVYDPTNSGVYNKAALQFDCTERIYRLSSPKPDYKGYTFGKSPYTTVAKAAQNASASFRLEMLCIPLKRKTTEKFKYEPNYFD